MSYGDRQRFYSNRSTTVYLCQTLGSEFVPKFEKGLNGYVHIALVTIHI